MYFETVFWRQAIYTPIPYYTTVASTAPMGGYNHVLSSLNSSPMTAIHQNAWWWNPTRAFSSRGVTTHFSYPKKSPLAPPPHKIYLTSSYPTPVSPKYSPFVPTFPVPTANSDPLPANLRQMTKKCFPSTSINSVPSAASHTEIKSCSYVPLYSQQLTSVASSLTRANT